MITKMTDAFSVATLCLVVALIFLPCSCEMVDIKPHPEAPEDSVATCVSMEDLARIMARLPIGCEQVKEVHDAVSGSVSNGYDEEYLMADLLNEPGTGVGGRGQAMDTKASAARYERPLRDLLSEYLESECTKTSGNVTYDNPAALLNALSSSSMQIYWPESEDWDGSSLPTITWDPDDGSVSNVGIRLGEGGAPEEIMVDEEYASKHPVWVVNMNDDSQYSTLQTIRRDNPDWTDGGGVLTIGGPAASLQASTRSGDAGSVRSLVLRSLTMKEHGDTWFCGGSEYFCKMGAIENFKASTEAELRLYNPQITDFMVVVKRKMLGVPQECNVMLVSDWTDQLSECAFMLIEDDGGTKTSWSCSGTVKIQSKSYGFDVSIPINTRDDIIWRGKLSSRYLQAWSGQTCSFGTVDLVFDFEEAQL